MLARGRRVDMLVAGLFELFLVLIVVGLGVYSENTTVCIVCAMAALMLLFFGVDLLTNFGISGWWERRRSQRANNRP